MVDSDDVGIGWSCGDKSFENEIYEADGEGKRWLDNDAVGEIVIFPINKIKMIVNHKRNIAVNKERESIYLCILI